MNIDLWRTAAITAAAVGQTLFVILYMAFPWWKNFLGRVLFGKALSLLVITDVVALSRWFEFWRNDYLFTALYLILALGVWAELIAFWQVQRKSKAAVREHGERRETRRGISA